MKKIDRRIFGMCSTFKLKYLKDSLLIYLSAWDMSRAKIIVNLFKNSELQYIYIYIYIKNFYDKKIYKKLILKYQIIPC